MRPQLTILRLLVLPLLLASCTAHQTQRGFFTGRRAEIVDLLRQANRQGANRDESIALALRANAQNEREGDVSLDLVIHNHLAQYYRDLGDEESASLYTAMTMDDLGSLTLDPGLTQGLYEVWLMFYDAEMPMDVAVMVPFSAGILLGVMAFGLLPEVGEEVGWRMALARCS